MWQLDRQSARWRGDRMELQIPLTDPRPGITDIRLCLKTDWQGLNGELDLLRVDHVGRTREVYVRGSDLVATFSPADERGCHVEVYWRALTDFPSEHVVSGVEMILSAWTGRLESDPRIDVISEVPSGRHRPCPGCPLRCAADPALDFLQLAHPSNQGSTLVREQEGRTKVRYRLFPEPLEKGVIRRGRLRGLFLPGTAPQTVVDELLRQFAESPPPLTT